MYIDPDRIERLEKPREKFFVRCKYFDICKNDRVERDLPVKVASCQECKARRAADYVRRMKRKKKNG